MKYKIAYNYLFRKVMKSLVEAYLGKLSLFIQFNTNSNSFFGCDKTWTVRNFNILHKPFRLNLLYNHILNSPILCSCYVGQPPFEFWLQQNRLWRILINTRRPCGWRGCTIMEAAWASSSWYNTPATLSVLHIPGLGLNLLWARTHWRENDLKLTWFANIYSGSPIIAPIFLSWGTRSPVFLICF